MLAETPRYMDTTLPIEDRVHHLLAEMTIEEKVAQLGGVRVTDLIDTRRNFDENKSNDRLQHGVGHITRVGAASLLDPPESAQLSNTIQKFLMEQTRLGIPAIVHEESCAGYMARGATTFPQAIGMAATWEPELIECMAGVIRKQMRYVGAHHTLAPVLDIVRDPRWGRIEETFGEDPYLISRIGVAYIKGVQTDDWHEGVVATGKHFLGYGASEGGLNWAPAHIPEREKYEIYVTPFKAAIQEANIGSIMNAYNEIDGIPAGSSRELMVDLLRDELGFDGVVVADYFTIDMFVQYHQLVQTKAQAAKLGLEAGIDVELPSHDCYGDPLLEAVEKGDVDVSLIDTSVGRLLRMKFELGLFENPYVDADKVSEVYDQPDHRDLTRQIAQKSIVLLKNEEALLPLSPELSSIAIIGPSADNIRLLQGDYHFPAHLGGAFGDVDASPSEDPHPVRLLEGSDALVQQFPPSISVLEGIKSIVSPQTQVHYAQGCTVTSDDTTHFDEAVQLAAQSEVAVVVVGGMSGLTATCTTGESIDRATLGLPGVQQQLVEAVHATGTPVVVVLLNGRPLSLPWIDENVPAILEAWLPAEQGGAAVADVLFGHFNPGGKLPVSIPYDVGQVPVYYNHKASGGRTHWQTNYIDMTVEPLYAFGHGLSYTEFEYRNLSIEATEATATETVQISIDVQNVGEYEGDEVVQLYLRDPIASVTRPVKELKGFKRIALSPKETKTVTFHLPVSHLGFYNRDMEFVVEPGTIEVMLGSSSKDIRQQGTFEIVGSIEVVEQVFNTPVEVK